jgi:hypothetical protein
MGALLFLPYRYAFDFPPLLPLPVTVDQQGENSAYASDSFSSFIRINFILFGGTQREGKAK